MTVPTPTPTPDAPATGSADAPAPVPVPAPRTAPAVGRAALAYALPAALALGLACVFLHVRSVGDLRVPLIYRADGLYYLAMHKTMDETGWYYFNDRVGGPGGLDYRDFPTGDGWAHLGVVAALLRLGLDPFVATNVFTLLTFPLAAASAAFVGRRLGLSYPVAVAVSVLYALLPYHVARVGHTYLIAYHFVPLAALLAVRHYQGRLPFRRTDGGWTVRTPAAAGALATAVLVGAGGIYYAYFGCGFLLVAAAARAAAERRWAPVLSAAAACAVVGGTLFVTMLPSVAYKLTHAKNADAAIRVPSESEHLGLKLVQMVMPVTGHRVKALREFKERYNQPSTPLINENDVATLGLVGSAGLALLAVRFLLLRGAADGGVLDALALLTVAGLLVGEVGGVGAVVSWWISPWIRAYNRISVFLAFFALVGAGFGLDWVGRRLGRGPAARAGLLAGLALLTAAGLYDLNSTLFAPKRAPIAAQFDDDREFVARVEAGAPRGGLVFQLPHVSYPERHTANGLNCYELFRPYLHSEHLRWSFGAVAGHLGDEWARKMTRLPTAEMLDRLAEADVAGVWVDRDGYADHGAQTEAEVRAAIGAVPAESRTGRHAYYDLRAFAAARRAAVPPADWQARRERALHPIVPLWRNGFFMYEPTPPAPSGYTHWCAQSGELHLGNTLSRPRRVRLRFYAWTPDRPGVPAGLRVRGDGWAEAVEVKSGATEVDRVVEVPPGTTVVRLSCHAPPLMNPGDARRPMVFAVANLLCDEVP